MRALIASAFLCTVLPGQGASDHHGSRPETLEIRNAHVVRGDGAPAFGPTSVFVRDGKIVSETIEDPQVVLDGTGCYVLPGLVSTHAHIQESSGGLAIPPEYQLNLWLASGITTVRDLGSTFGRSLQMRQKSARGEIAAPRIFLYQSFGAADSEEVGRARVRAIRDGGADGIKLWSNFSYRPDILAAIFDEARSVGLRATAHIGVGESNALHYAAGGVTSLEHWYGIPDAALDGVQAFPPDFSYSNEVDRFRYAGQLWQQTDPERLDGVLRYLVDQGVAWSPTLAVYEASRDLVRAQNKPWFEDHLHPGIERFFRPDLDSHGSYFIGWSSADEAAWRENYRIWMGALRRFEAMGGIITTGEDAGFIYLLYGFGLCRELELHQEAGFHPLEVVRHATYNGARVLGMEQQFGRVLPGLAADLAVVRGNPLQNLKCLYPTGCDVYEDGRSKPTGGVLYTIKDGRIYHGPTLMETVRRIVREARANRSDR
jgi:imidazolonepropionase-like amidohydrolase